MKVNYTPNQLFKTTIQTPANKPYIKQNSTLQNDIFTKSHKQIAFKGGFEEIEKDIKNCKFCYQYYYDETSELIENTKRKIDETMTFPNFDTSYIDDTIKKLKTNISKDDKMEIAFEATEKIELQNKRYLDEEATNKINKKGLEILKEALDSIASNIKTIEELETKTLNKIVEIWKKELEQEKLNYQKIQELAKYRFALNSEHEKIKNITKMGENLGNYVYDKNKEYLEKRSEKINYINKALEQIYTLMNK